MPVSKHRRKTKKGGKHPAQSKIVVTVALYGPDDSIATKLVASAVQQKNGKIRDMKKWFSNDSVDVRTIKDTVQGVADFIEKWKPSTVVSPDRIIGCPHEEGIDYPEGEACPQCNFWRNRDRFSGELLL